MLEKLPNQSELYFWADYVELRCMTDPDGNFSLDRLTQQMAFADDLKESSREAQDADDGDVNDLIGELMLADEFDDVLSSRDGTDLVPDLHTQDEFSLEVEYEDYGRASELRDKRRRWCEDVFRLIASRALLLGDAYPFDVSADSMAIERRAENEDRLVYSFYLACSSLRYVDKSTRQRLTSVFEVVSSDVLRGILPHGAVVDVFGTARGLAASIFSGSLYERIEQLAQKLGGKVVVQEGDFHPQDTADNGLDLVAWIPLGDDMPGFPSFFAQCACGSNWAGKQSEASYLQRWHRFISLVSPSVAMTFIPHFFRKAGAHWYAQSDVESVLIDRLRAMRLHLADEQVGRSVPFELTRTGWNFRLEAV